MIDCDVLVIGAGPAGCATATQAARGGLSTVLLDRARATRTWAGESLPPGVGTPIRSVFGDRILSERHHRQALGTRSVWGNDDLAETDFFTNPLGNGWILDRGRFDRDARDAAAAAGVTVVEIRRFEEASRESPLWRVRAGDGLTMTAKLLVDATGRSGALLRNLGIRRTAADRQVAILATFADEGDAYRGTTVEAVAEGWWYTTPLPDGRRVLAYLTDQDLWRRNGRDWQAMLGNTRHIGRCAGDNAMSAKPRAYPAEAAHADQIVGENWLAVGDAAASFDPLSSQGLASAVIMGAKAGAALASADRGEAIATWMEAYAMLVAEHDDLRTYYARLVDRWPQSVFWRRRQGPRHGSARPRWTENPYDRAALW